MPNNQRRLPNGRFAKVVNLPEPQRRPGPKGSGPVIIINTDAAIRKQDLSALRQRVPLHMLRDAEAMAQRVQLTIQTEMGLLYSRGTGRAARGIRAKVARIKDGDKEGAGIKVTAINYREMRFITNLNGTGYFKFLPYPVPPYTIYAKGAEDLDIDLDRKTGHNRTKTYIRSLLRRNDLGRLKVPRPTAFFTTVRRGRGPAESRQIRDILGPPDPGDNASAFFFYPLWVNHPGFSRDVISDVVARERSLYAERTLQQVKASHAAALIGKSAAQPAVIGEIPLPSLSVYLSRGRITSGQSTSSRRFT